MDQKSTPPIYVFGLGALGSNILAMLSRIYQDAQFYGIDYDKVEERNLRTQSYFLEHLNHPKVTAMQAVLHRTNKKPKYKPINQKITAPIPIDAGALVLDCFDNVESREILRKLKCDHLLHLGFSPQFSAEILWERKGFSLAGPVKSDVDICTLNTAGPFIQFVCGLAVMQIVRFLDDGEKKDYVVSGKQLIKPL